MKTKGKRRTGTNRARGDSEGGERHGTRGERTRGDREESGQRVCVNKKGDKDATSGKETCTVEIESHCDGGGAEKANTSGGEKCAYTGCRKSTRERRVAENTPIEE